jgi:hypothetical protein
MGVAAVAVMEEMMSLTSRLRFIEKLSRPLSSLFCLFGFKIK